MNRRHHFQSIGFAEGSGFETRAAAKDWLERVIGSKVFLPTKTLAKLREHLLKGLSTIFAKKHRDFNRLQWSRCRMAGSSKISKCRMSSSFAVAQCSGHNPATEAVSPVEDLRRKRSRPDVSTSGILAKLFDKRIQKATFHFQWGSRGFWGIYTVIEIKNYIVETTSILEIRSSYKSHVQTTTRMVHETGNNIIRFRKTTFQKSNAFQKRCLSNFVSECFRNEAERLPQVWNHVRFIDEILEMARSTTSWSRS